MEAGNACRKGILAAVDAQVIVKPLAAGGLGFAFLWGLWNVELKPGIDAFFPIVRGVCTLEEAMDKVNAQKNMQDTAEQVFRLLI